MFLCLHDLNVVQFNFQPVIYITFVLLLVKTSVLLQSSLKCLIAPDRRKKAAYSLLTSLSVCKR